MTHTDIVLLLASHAAAFVGGSVLTWKLRGHLSDLENSFHAKVAAVDAKVSTVVANVKKP